VRDIRLVGCRSRRRSVVVSGMEPEGRKVGCQGGFAWRAHQEGVTYAAAIVSFVALGVVLRTALLNWVAGPLYFVCFVWASAALLERRRRSRP
jgi:hypothetical protein